MKRIPIPSMVLLACGAMLSFILFSEDGKPSTRADLAIAKSQIYEPGLNTEMHPAYNPFNVVPPVEVSKRKLALLFK